MSITAWLSIGRDECDNPNAGTGGYWFVRIYYQEKRRAIALHKLLWMVKYDRCVPQGHVLHHLKTKDDNIPDVDTQLVTHEEHYAIHNTEEEIPF